MLTATCNALSFLKGHHVSRLVGGVHPDDGQSVSPLAPPPAGGWEGSEKDDGDDVLPASKKAASDTCPDCGTFFQRQQGCDEHKRDD